MSRPAVQWTDSHPEPTVLDAPVNEVATDVMLEAPSSTITSPAARIEAWKSLPWWKRPSPYWVLCAMPISTMAMTAIAAPKIAIFTEIVCAVHKPEISNSLINNCASDPTVLAGVAKLTTAISGCLGVLSCLTTGWWGSFSDRHGRTRLLGVSVLGLLISDAIFLLVVFNFRVLPGGYWFILVGPVLEGTLGGFSAAIAGIHVYLSDTTTSETRSRYLSLNLGLIFTGTAVGPTLGSLVIRFTGQPIILFYAAFACHLLYASLVWLVLPEPLSSDQMKASTLKYRAAAALQQEAGLLPTVKRAFGFLTPLAIFVPTPTDKRGHKDWSLTLIAIAYGSTISIMGSYSVKFQYAGSAGGFNWSSEQIGYWLGFSGVARAIYLAILLPAGIRLFKAIREKRNLATPESERLLNEPVAHSSTFDLVLARGSLLIDLVAYVGMGLTSSPLLFTVATVMSAFGTGFSPAVQSVAAELYTQKGGTESGRLFGGLSVVQAISGQVIGPAIYGAVFIWTVQWFPRAIFFVSVASITLSFVMMALVRLPEQKQPIALGPDADVEDAADTQNDTLVNIRAEGSRKRTSMVDHNS